MYTCIEDNKEIMTMLRRNKESLEANCIVLKAVSGLPYEKQLEITKIRTNRGGGIFNIIKYQLI